MALDIRLDFITNICPEHIDTMPDMRRNFVIMDAVLMTLADQAEAQQNQAASRTIALARTNHEIALQYAIKSLCLLGEIKA
jgi:hypothetical protein